MFLEVKIYIFRIKFILRVKYLLMRMGKLFNVYLFVSCFLLCSKIFLYFVNYGYGIFLFCNF